MRLGITSHRGELLLLLFVCPRMTNKLDILYRSLYIWKGSFTTTGTEARMAERRGSSQRQVHRRYVRRTALGFGSYVVVLVPVLWWLSQGQETWWRVPVALLPVLPIAYGLWSMRKYFREADEMVKRIQLEGFTFGFAGAAMTTLTYGFLEIAGFPRLSAWWYWSAMGLFWIIGEQLARRARR